MAHRVLGQGSLAGTMMSPKAGVNARLKRIAGLLDWSGFAALLGDLHAGTRGRPSWPLGRRGHGAGRRQLRIARAARRGGPAAAGPFRGAAATGQREPSPGHRPSRPRHAGASVACGGLSLGSALATALCAASAGTLLGLLAALRGGILERGLLALSDTVQAVPALLARIDLRRRRAWRAGNAVSGSLTGTLG